MLKDVLAVVYGAGIVLVYFFLYNMMVRAARRLSPTTAQAIVLFSYFGRLAVVGALLILAVAVARLDGFLTSVSFLVIYTMGLLYSQRRAAKTLAAADLSGRKG